MGGGMMRMMSRRMMMRLIVAAVVAITAWFGKNKAGKTSGSGGPSGGEQQGEFTVFPEARLVSHKNNDGDSFLASHNGQKQEYRLYFVDTPETKDHYDSNKERIRDQASDFGGISYQETISVGKDAKKFTANVLKKPFRVYTINEKVFQGPRLYAFIEVEYEGERRWLHELLVEKGLARIHTKGVTTPEGDSWKTQKGKLAKIEKTARQAGLGAWGR